MAVKEQAQVGMEDKFLEDPELEALLDEREEAKEGRSVYTKIDKQVKARLTELHDEGQLGEGALRVGRFVLSAKPSAPRAVNFETQGGTRFSIALADEE